MLKEILFKEGKWIVVDRVFSYTLLKDKKIVCITVINRDKTNNMSFLIDRGNDNSVAYRYLSSLGYTLDSARNIWIKNSKGIENAFKHRIPRNRRRMDGSDSSF